MARGHRAGEILAALRETPGGRDGPAAIHGAVLEAQAEAEAHARPPRLDTEEARARIERGEPLLSDPAPTRWLAAPAFSRLTARLGSLTRSEASMDGKEALAAFVAGHAERMLFRAAAAALAPLVDDSRWLQGQCPVCGAEPDLAVVDDGTAGRRLLCCRCDTAWAFPRIGCPFCDNDDPGRLAYHPVGEGGGYRLYVCGRCRRYLKAVDLRQRPRACLPVERILTAGLDAAAVAAGYAAAERLPPAST